MLVAEVAAATDGMCANDASESHQLDACRVLRGRVPTGANDAGTLAEVAATAACVASMANGMMGACFPARIPEPRACVFGSPPS